MFIMFMTSRVAGVPGGSIASGVKIEVVAVGSHPERCSFIKFDRPKVQRATRVGKKLMRIDPHKEAEKWECC